VGPIEDLFVEFDETSQLCDGFGMIFNPQVDVRSFRIALHLRTCGAADCLYVAAAVRRRQAAHQPINSLSQLVELLVGGHLPEHFSPANKLPCTVVISLKIASPLVRQGP
jgi:hypothetical protein